MTSCCPGWGKLADDQGVFRFAAGDLVMKRMLVVVHGGVIIQSTGNEIQNPPPSILEAR